MNMSSAMMFFPATDALQRQNQENSWSDSSVSSQSEFEFDTNALFEQLESVEAPFALPFPTIAWPEFSDSEDSDVSTSKPKKTKKSSHKSRRRSKHRMVRSKSHHNDLASLGSACSIQSC